MAARYCGNSWYPGVEGLSIGVGLPKPGTFFLEPRSGGVAKCGIGGLRLAMSGV